MFSKLITNSSRHKQVYQRNPISRRRRFFCFRLFVRWQCHGQECKLYPWCLLIRICCDTRHREPYCCVLLRQSCDIRWSTLALHLNVIDSKIVKWCFSCCGACRRQISSIVKRNIRCVSTSQLYRRQLYGQNFSPSQGHEGLRSSYVQEHTCFIQICFVIQPSSKKRKP